MSLTSSDKNNVIEQVRKILDKIQDPKSEKGLLNSGLIEGFSFDKNRLSFALNVPENEVKFYASTRGKVEHELRNTYPSLDIFVALTAHKSLEKGATSSSPSPTKSNAFLLPNIKRIVAVASGKGGVGKSTVSLNLALSLQKLGLNVGFLDLDIYGPSLPLMTGLQGPLKTNANKKLQPLDFKGMPVMSMGFLIPSASPVIWRGPMIQSGVRQLFMDVAWPDLDVLILDLPPGTGDTQLTLAQKAPLSGVVIVSTPQDLALADVRKAIAMFQKLETPIWGLIENMSTYTCPHCLKDSHPFSQEGSREIAAEFDIPFLGILPLSPTLLQSVHNQREKNLEDLSSGLHLFEEITKKVKERLS